MLAVLLTLALFLAWCVVGLAALVAFRADVSDLRVALTAPALGSALTVLPLFALSNAGVSMETGAPPVGVALLLGSIVVLVVRRPRLSLAVAPVVVLCIVDLALVGRPMFQFGFDWIANANGDMAFYVLAATQLMGHGLLSPVDLDALANNRDFATTAQLLHLAGIRPGGQIGLSGLAAITGLPPVALYMPMLMALNMCGISAAASLAMQASRRWWSASVAAALLVASPLAAYGVLQQLMPQVWGLGLSVALSSWLMRSEIHNKPGPRILDLFLISVLTVALFVVYAELAATLLVAYGLYLALLVARRRVSLRAVGLLWGVPLAAIVIVVNTFLPREFGYLSKAAQFGARPSDGDVLLFGYALVPTAIPGAAGLQTLFAAPATPNMQVSIIVAAGLFAGLFIACLLTARKGAAAAIVVLGDVVLGCWLAWNSNEFGLFKMYMYIQPFLAAAVAVALATLKQRFTLAAASILLAMVVGAQFLTLNEYVDKSRDPVDLPNASAPDLLPAFRKSVRSARDPVVVVAENFILASLQGAEAGETPLYFVGRNVFALPWKERIFRLSVPHNGRPMTFGENTDASRLLSEGSCVVSFPTGSQLTLNRRTLPDGSRNLSTLPCKRTRNLLTFVVSSLGQAATLAEDLKAVSFWQLEKDPSFPGRTFSGFGRYALFQILGPTPRLRVVLDFTTSFTQSRDGSYRLPPVAMSGVDGVRFPVVGSGSARVFSPPLRPRIIGGHPYVVLDIGKTGQFPLVRRPGVTGLWGKSVPLDPRSLTSYVRDVSIVSEDEYERLRAPLAIRSIPADLANVNLEYSGIFEDGWLDQESYAHLAGGSPARLVIRALVLPRRRGQRLRVVVNGRLIDSRSVPPGLLALELPLSASRGRRKIELRWTGVTRLAAPDRRSAAARLTFLGVSPR